MSEPGGATRLEALVAPTSLLRVLRRHWLLLLLNAVLIAILVWTWSSRRPAVYESAGQVRLSTSTSPFEDGSASARDQERRILDEVERFQSAPVLQRTARIMEGNWTLNEVRRSLTVRGDARTNYITIVAEAPTRREAGLLVTRAVDAYEQVVTEEAQADAEERITQIDAYVADLSARADQLQADLDARRAVFEADMPQLEPTEYTRELERRLALDQTYQGLSRRLTSTAGELEGLQAEAVQARLGAALGGSGIEDFEITRASTTPVSPAPLRDALLAGVLTIALGAALLWARAGREPGHVGAERTATALGAPLLARVAPRRGAPAPVGPHDRSRDEYARVLAAIEFELVLHSSTSAVFTGPRGDVGTTAAVMSVGAVAARMGRSALVVDADLRERQLTRALGLEGRPGWSDLGAGTHDLDACVDMVTVEGGVVAVVPAGTRHDLQSAPSGARLEAVLAELAEWQVVLVDTAPVLTAAETTVVAQAVDHVVVVVPPECDVESVRGIMARLARAATPVLGVVESRGRRPGWLPRQRRAPRSRRGTAAASEPGGVELEGDGRLLRSAGPGASGRHGGDRR